MERSAASHAEQLAKRYGADPVGATYNKLLRLNDWLVDSGEGEHWPEEWLRACGHALMVLGMAKERAK